MMFEGKLLAEAPPEQLITEYGKQNLDDVFLHLVLTTKHLLEDDFSVDDDSGQLLNPSIKVKQTYVVDSEKDTADADTCTQPDAMSRHQRQSFITKCNAAKTVFLDHVRTVFQPISLRRLSAVVFKDLAQMRHNIG